MKLHAGIVVLILLALCIPSGVQALAMYSGDSVRITEPVDDDVFASGGTVDVSAPVSSLTAAGGTITINAPVSGNVIVAGGTININAPVAGDVITAGGTINANDDIGGKLVAAGGVVNVAGDIATNAVIYGGSVYLEKSVTVGRDAAISGGTVTNAAAVNGTLTIEAQEFQNAGSAGDLDVTIEKPDQGFSSIVMLIGILVTIGMFVLGLVTLHVAPKRFLAVEAEVRKSPLVRTVVGFIGIIVVCVLLIILAITMIGIPLAIVAGLVFIISLLYSGLFVSSATGRIIAGYFKWELNEWKLFLIGFVVINLLIRIPYLGMVILIIVVSLGMGATGYAIKDYWNAIRGEESS